ncbi:MAG: PH domain-containing protein [Hamadaea sp.]|uniref:PH domain-containing protein n=1 Tax=Hamadaea sp. TaxID=2024425 RepID=UPI001799E876|nr:PH domain-containing protein [Hamadaea sp.]NUT20425.1 PH domain-containing protein [Hamadaea sp.]
MRWMIGYEVRMWHALIRWIARRPPKGGRPFRYAAPVVPIIWTFIVLSAVEIPIVDLLLPWKSVRIVMLALGAWGVTWMVGLLASMYVNTHAIGDEGITVRNGLTVDFFVPWEAIAEVRVNKRPLQSSKTVHFDQTSAGPALSVAVGSQTAVDLVLAEPHVVRLPSGDSEPLAEIRINADDPAAFVAEAREHLSRRRAESAPAR